MTRTRRRPGRWESTDPDRAAELNGLERATGHPDETDHTEEIK